MLDYQRPQERASGHGHGLQGSNDAGCTLCDSVCVKMDVRGRMEERVRDRSSGVSTQKLEIKINARIASAPSPLLTPPDVRCAPELSCVRLSTAVGRGARNDFRARSADGRVPQEADSLRKRRM